MRKYFYNYAHILLTLVFIIFYVAKSFADEELNTTFSWKSNFSDFENYLWNMFSHSIADLRVASNEWDRIDEEKVLQISLDTINDPNSSPQDKTVAYYYAGYLLLTSEGENKNLEKPFKYLSISANNNYPPALYELGRMYDYGMHVEKDVNKAEELIRKSINLGYLEGYAWLYYIYQHREDYINAAKFAKTCFEVLPYEDTCKMSYAKYLYWHDYYLDMPYSEETELEAIKLMSEIADVNVTAALWVIDYYSKPDDIFETELKYLELLDEEKYPELDHFYSNMIVYKSLADLYNFSVSSEKAIKYSYLALDNLNYYDEIYSKKDVNQRQQILKSLLQGYLYSGKTDEAKKLLNQIRNILEFQDKENNHFSDYNKKTYLWEAKFYEAEIYYFDYNYEDALEIFLEIEKDIDDLDIFSYGWQVKAYIASIYSINNDINISDELFKEANESYQIDYSWQFEEMGEEFPIFPYELIDLYLEHLKKTKGNIILRDNINQYIKDAKTYKEKNPGLLADALSRSIILYFAESEFNTCIRYGEEAYELIKKTQRGKMHTKLHVLLEKIGDCYQKLENRIEAEEYYLESTKVYEEYFTDIKSPNYVLRDGYKRVIHKLIDLNYQKAEINLDKIFNLIQKSRISDSSEAIYKMYIASEDKNEFNELVISRSDIINNLRLINEDIDELKKRIGSEDILQSYYNESETLTLNLKKIDDLLNEKYDDKFEYYFERNVQIQDVQKYLKQDEAIINYSLYNDYNFVFYIDKNKTQILKLDFNNTKLKNKIIEFNKKITNEILIDDIASELYKILFKPVESFSTKNKILISYEGILSNVPFSALKDSNSWLVENYIFSYVPTISSFVYLHKNINSDFNKILVGFADPNLSNNNDSKMSANLISNVLRSNGKQLSENIMLLPSLPNTESELRKISKILNDDTSLYFDDEATEINLINEDLSTEHLVFATHALLPGELDKRTEPALVLTPPKTITNKENDGVLTSNEILDLSLNTSITVLSACNTAVQDELRGESLSGLTKSFFYAGSQNVLSTLWSIETFSAEEMTTNFFLNTQDHEYSKSIQLSKIGLLKSEKYSHPFYWAPFIIAGID